MGGRGVGELCDDNSNEEEYYLRDLNEICLYYQPAVTLEWLCYYLIRQNVIADVNYSLESR
jgi:hypothetical protein